MSIQLDAATQFPALRWLACTLVMGASLELVRADGPGEKKMSATAERRTGVALAENEGALVSVSILGTCKSGQPAPLSIAIRNRGDNPFYCDEARGLPNVRMEMKLENRDTKAAVEMTAYGKNVFKWLGYGSRGLTKIEKDHERKWSIDLSEFFPFARGNYRFSATLVLRRDDRGHNFKVVVENLDFTVSD